MPEQQLRSTHPVAPDEAERLEAVRESCLLDTPPEPIFDDLTALAARVFDVPIVLLSVIDEERQFFKSVVGLTVRECPRHISFCTHAIGAEDTMVVSDTRLDKRFQTNPFVIGEPYVRFYAGCPLHGRGGHRIGTFCIVDLRPRNKFTPTEQIELQRFSALASKLIEQRLLERELRIANERFVLVTRASADGMWDLDYLSGDLHCSGRMNQLLGLPDQDSVSELNDWMARLHPYDRNRVNAHWTDLQQSRELSLELEFRCRHEDGSWRWLVTRVFCQRQEDGTLLRMAGTCSDITAAKMVDPLTGLHNRTSLLEHLQWRIDRQHEHRRHYGLLFVDLDAFKRVNDSLGHRGGDKVLVEVGRRLEQTTIPAPGCVVSRLGGDEFVILVDDMASSEDMVTYALLLEYLLSAPVDCDGHQVFVSASVGVVFGGSASYTHAEQVLEDADLAMYRAKMHGKSQNAMFSERMREEARARLRMESELRLALGRGEFEVWFQPKVWLANNQIKGFEALLRWRHPVRGLVSPAEFIPIAEEIGLIGEIGRWVAAQSIGQLAKWRESGIVNGAATMAVNVSPRQFKEPDLLSYLSTVLRDWNVPASCFVVEVTESFLVGDSADGVAMLEAIVASGMGLDLDDFGTGYSSLSYLHRLPFRSVKVDRSFIGRMSTDAASVTLVASIVSLAASLKLGVVAEGVETESQAKHLRDMGCDSAQGFLFSPPRPAEELERYLRERRVTSERPGIAAGFGCHSAYKELPWGAVLPIM